MHTQAINRTGLARRRLSLTFLLGVTLLQALPVQAAATAVAAPATLAGKLVPRPGLLVMGDSLSAEYGITRGTGWVPLLEKRLLAEKIDVAVVNASISGETTSGGRTRLQALLDKVHPSAVVIELGANDGLRGLPVAAAQANLLAMIETSQKAGARVLLVGMQLPPNYGPDYTRSFAAMYPRLAAGAKVALVPFMLKGLDENTQFQADRLHPVAAAQPAILENIWPYLKPLLATTVKTAGKRQAVPQP